MPLWLDRNREPKQICNGNFKARPINIRSISCSISRIYPSSCNQKNYWYKNGPLYFKMTWHGDQSGRKDEAYLNISQLVLLSRRFIPTCCQQHFSAPASYWDVLQDSILIFTPKMFYLFILNQRLSESLSSSKSGQWQSFNNLLIYFL